MLFFALTEKGRSYNWSYSYVMSRRVLLCAIRDFSILFLNFLTLSSLLYLLLAYVGFS